jgi:dTDP-D-glucose 4,6-dehydratase
MTFSEKVLTKKNLDWLKENQNTELNVVLEDILDFEINALGTINVLEAARNTNTDPVLIFTSTNKVYGKIRK